MNLFGGLLDAGQVDEFVIHDVPTLIGAGIPLVQPAERTVQLSPVPTRRFTDGVVRLHYIAGHGKSGGPRG